MIIIARPGDINVVNVVNGLPTYGNFGGAGWFGGNAIDPGSPIDPKLSEVPPIDPLDALFREHDLEYYDAESVSDRSERAKAFALADLNLLVGMNYLDPGLLSPWGQIYRMMATTAFYYKMLLWDIPPVLANYWINPEVNTQFQFAQVPIDPLALDLDGDGVETIGISDWQTTVLFDHDADGQKTGTGWVHADDGLLVRDLDGNGTIDSGRELFGDQTRLANGSLAADAYAALADLDSNQDGRIDANDAAFAQLQVWQDRNQDGISQADELSTLAERGIQSLSTLNQTNGNWQNGNTILSTGEYSRTDGATGVTGGLAFGSANFFSQFQDSISVTDQVSLLPDMHGSGQVRDLRQAAGYLVTPSRFSHCTLKQCESRFHRQGLGLEGMLRGIDDASNQFRRRNLSLTRWGRVSTFKLESINGECCG